MSAVVEQLKESLGQFASAIKDNAKTIGEHGAAIEEHGKRTDEVENEVRKLRKLNLARGFSPASQRRPGMVSDECARHVAAQFILLCARSGRLEAFCDDATKRDAFLAESRQVFGMEMRAALTTTEIPLPTTFTGELRELIAEFGVARKVMFPYPLSGGTSRPPRMGTRPQFGSIAMSAPFSQLLPTITFASMQPHKIGGIVIVPREIEDQSIVQFGQFLAMYGAVEFARAEDTWAFLADGSGTYETVEGVCKICTDNNKIVTLGPTKTAPSDATLADFRAMRRKVSTAVLGFNGAYYLNKTWEMRLRDFNTEADPNIFVILPDGSARLDGYPIVWTEVLTAYDTAAAANSYVAVFGNLRFWWFGERGTPRIDTSEHVLFQNDQLATRFIEEIDIDYCAIDAASVLRTAAV